MINKRPLSYVLNVRMDIRKFASIVDAYIKAGLQTDKIGRFSRIALEDFSDLLVENGKADRFETADEANKFLESRGLKGQSLQARVGKTYLQGMPSNISLSSEDPLDKQKPSTPSEAPDESPPISVEDVLSRIRKTNG